MKIDGRRIARALAAALWLLAPAAHAAADGREAGYLPSDQTLDAIIARWPARSQALVRTMIEKYGIPNRMDRLEIVWYDNAPWKRTAVHRDSWSGLLGSRDHDYLEQTIRLSVPEDKAPALKRFGERIEVDKSGGELSSRAGAESLNFLALNLAAEISAGARSVKDARDFYRKTEELAKAGKTSPYLEGFVFGGTP